MWKSLLSSSQKVIRPSCTSHPTVNLTTPIATRRTLVVSPRFYKDKAPNDFDRESLNPQRTEVTKSGTDSEIAQHDTAWDPSTTSPERELEATEEESHSKGKKGTLNMSPANQDVNKWRGPEEGGPARNADKESTSKRGQPNKRRTVHVKEDGTHVSYR
ncbi:uncharacterized protein N7482_004204 [Penicillium canariense]|uniref:Uncharacterized protein n=1 Tax=Penicillium canariense TaxID=189055 RepID=A0A9W9LQ22_9EURO|nr:uncharacterized protein N7482_004204 [Penicillium canariense]KAJ5168610.1 hypothetical protein N7482_004204 [Penicillium canariense]